LTGDSLPWLRRPRATLSEVENGFQGGAYSAQNCDSGKEQFDDFAQALTISA
jgi:hypothetical protein